MYPLKFEPILKQTLWGGDKIIPFKHLNSDLKGVGESWEISGVEDNESVVANGPDKGLTLADMVRINSHCLSNSSMQSRIYPFRCIRQMIWQRKGITQWVKPKCGM